VLGWGGYWGWDPVENVALLPWLVATAFLHSIMVQERRGMLKVWNLSLAIASFALAVFGTFVVRSGILSSVHSFAVSNIGPAFFVFLALTVAVPVVLLLFRLPLLQSEAEFDGLVSRESGFLLNNLLLVGAAAAVLWGTIFPLLAEATQGVKVSVGAPFYHAVVGPILLALLLLMGLGPLLAWRRTSAAALRRSVRWPVVVAIVVGALLYVAGVRKGLALVAFTSAAFTAATIGYEYWRGVRARLYAGDTPAAGLWRLVRANRRRYGGYVVHLAMVFIACGIIASFFYQTEVVATVPAGGSVAAGRYTVTFEGLSDRQEPGVGIISANLALLAGDQLLGPLAAERRLHRGWEQQPVTRVAIDTTWPWLEDVYVLLSALNDDGSVELRVFVNPLVCLIWFGGGLFIAGTAFAAWPASAAQRQRQAAGVGRAVASAA
jgi:cytochrome c-type biogenesis protein CcmF